MNSVSPARNTDPETSHKAAAANDVLRSKQRQDVLIALSSFGTDGATDYELACKLSILRTSAGKRRKELMDAGLVQKTPLTRPTDTGSPGIVWRITEPGLRAAEGLKQAA